MRREGWVLLTHLLRSRTVVSLVLPSLAACDSLSVAAPDLGRIQPNPALGAAAFAVSCAVCHASGDGFDLAYFSYPDSTIIRRAVAHVDSNTARDIVAYVRTLSVQPVARDNRPFQPRDALADTDLAFALRLFGTDAWPADLTSEGLRAIDLRQVPTALRFPLWSQEQGNMDWMPDDPLSGSLLDYGDEPARKYLDAYLGHRSSENLRAAVSAVRRAERDSLNAAAPCVRPPLARFQPRACFEVRRWTATLIAQHLLRFGTSETVDTALYNVWWDVGDAARIGRARDGDFENGIANWATWMYLGWSFGASNETSVWLGDALTLLGLRRHAVFTILRSQVARPRGSPIPYNDLVFATQFAPGGWAFPVVKFGYAHLLARVKDGDVPPVERRQQATEAISSVFNAAAPKLTPPQQATLAALRDEIAAYLQ